MSLNFDNIIYIHNFNVIGGTESFCYYLCRKYKDFDIAVVYKNGDEKQVNRLKQYVRVIKYNGQNFKCKKAFFNYLTDIIDNIQADEYIQIIHTDYQKQGLIYSKHPKINRILGVTQIICDSFKDYTGYNCELAYNPIELDKPKKVLHLISATRLTKEKGRDRMIQLGKLLNEAKIPYLWTVFTNDYKNINNPNIVYMSPRLDISNYIADSDYLVQLSDEGEGYGYTIAEALILGTPVIVTPNQAFIEIGVKNNENGFIVNFDMDNIDIQKIYKSVLKFNYEPMKDIYDKILINGKSKYQEDKNRIVEAECIYQKGYFDLDLNKHIDYGEKFKTNIIRGQELEEKGLVKINE